MSDSTRARELLAGITPGPWERRIGPPDQTPAEYIADTEGVDGEPLHIVIAPSPEEQFAYVVPAITGNGPTSRVNAEFIAAAPQLVADLLSDLATARNVIKEVREWAASELDNYYTRTVLRILNGDGGESK